MWDHGTISLQPVRAGFPCFAAALVGYVEATVDGEGKKNRLCPPSPLANTLQEWALMQVRGARAARAFSSDARIRAWADTLALNPNRMAPEDRDRADVAAALERVQRHQEAGLERMAVFAGAP